MRADQLLQNKCTAENTFPNISHRSIKTYNLHLDPQPASWLVRTLTKRQEEKKSIKRTLSNGVKGEERAT